MRKQKVTSSKKSDDEACPQCGSTEFEEESLARLMPGMTLSVGYLSGTYPKVVQVCSSCGYIPGLQKKLFNKTRVRENTVFGILVLCILAYFFYRMLGG